MTRMGIAATSVVFVIHFANKSIRGKIIFGAIGIMALLAVFNSKRFQEKTFYGGTGTLSELTLITMITRLSVVVGGFHGKKRLSLASRQGLFGAMAREQIMPI